MRGALEAAAVRVAPTMNAQDVANMIWGLATLGWQARSDLSAVLQQLVEAFAHKSGPTQLSTAHLSQLLQAHLASQFLGLRLITLPSLMLDVAVKSYREEARKVTVSNSQREVGESLRRLGISHELEYTTADGLFRIDLAITDRRIALEFDGPSHFTTNTLEPLGHTRLRDRLLSAMGWHVVSIPFFDWDRLHDRPEQMDASSSSGSCKILQNLRRCGTGRSCCREVSKVLGIGLWLRPPQPLHPSDRAPTSVCIVCAFQCVNLASPAAGAHRAGYGYVSARATKALCQWTTSRRLSRFGWPPRWCDALGGARTRGFIVAMDTRTLMTLRLLLNFEQNMCTASSSTVQLERAPANREKRCRCLLSLEGRA